MQFLYALILVLLDAVFPPSGDALVVRVLAMKGLDASYAPTHIKNTEYPTISLLAYADEDVKAFIRETKFADNRCAAALLGHVLHTFLVEDIYQMEVCMSETVVLIPIPLSPSRMKERGYNQAERILRHAEPLTSNYTIDTTILSRTRNTQPQTSLSGIERRKNLAGAFTALTCTAQHTYIIVDDVFTTGSTMNAAAKALEVAGAHHIICLALAH